MSTQVVSMTKEQNIAKIEQVLINGDLSVLKPEERLVYYKSVCESVGLNPLTKPFDYITLNNRLVLYAKKDATDQLRKLHKVSIKVVSTQSIEGVYVVVVSATDSTGREDSATGAVNVQGIKGDSLANAYMKAETKAKRRVTLSICGLGLLDETEIADIPEKEKRTVIPGQPGPDDGDQSDVNGYRIPFGKFAQRSLEEVGPDALKSYIAYLENDAAKKGQKLSEKVADFVARAEEFIGAFENS